MPETAVKLPADDSSTTGWTLSSGTSAATLLADDSDLTYISTDTQNSIFYCSFDTAPVEAITITKVEARVRGAMANEAGSVYIAAKIDTDESLSPFEQIEIPTVATTSAYVEVTKPGTGDWTVEDFNAAVFGCKAVSVPFEDSQTIFQMDVRVTYTTEADSSSAPPQPVGSSFSRPYYRIHLTKDIKPRKVRSK